jgi:integrase
LVRFLAFGGFRNGEASKITWADCDFEKGKIRVTGDAITGTKNWQVRQVPMIEEMKLLLKRLRTERPNALHFRRCPLSICRLTDFSLIRKTVAASGIVQDELERRFKLVFCSFWLLI